MDKLVEYKACGISIKRSQQVKVNVGNFEEVETETAPLDEHLQRANILRDSLKGFRFPEETEFEAEKRLGVEQALQAANFHEVQGFRAQPNNRGPPKFSLKPNPRTSEVDKFKVTSKRDWGLQTITLKQNNRKVISFTYRPKFWTFCQRKSLTGDIYVPQQRESIGQVTYRKLFEDQAVIIDGVSRSTFLISKIEPYCPRMCTKFPRIMFSNNLGMPMALAAGTTPSCCQFCCSGITDYVLNFSPEAEAEASASVKGVIALGFTMWIIMHREESRRKSMTKYFMLQLLVFIGSIIYYVYRGWKANQNGDAETYISNEKY